MANLNIAPSSARWDQILNCSELQSLLQSQRMIRTLSVDAAGRIKLQTCSWETYWSDFYQASESRHWLDPLCTARRQYIDANYCLDAAAAYSQAYFSALRHFLDRPESGELLRALLGMESFGIRLLGGTSVLAAGTVTLRHPVYLLSKLREPKAYEDPKFLPVIYPWIADSADPPSLFYHYRQLKIQSEPAASLLLYPSIDLACRRESFACVEAVSSALSYKPDPRSKQRARLITDWAIAPFLDKQRSQQQTRSEVSFLDFGGGSGALLAEICKRLAKEFRPIVSDRKFVWSIIDVRLQDALRRTHNRLLRQSMSYIEYQSADYLEWILERSRDDPSQYDVALFCRLLNNLSCFSIETTEDPGLKGKMTRTRNSLPSHVFHPADCLQGPAPDCRALVASNARLRICLGTTFRQASLSDYFRGLHQMSYGKPMKDSRSLFFPVRRFNEEALLLPDGSSMFHRLSKMVEFIVIEDVDLNEDILVAHLNKHRLNQLVASDATDRVQMQTATLLCICHRERLAALPGRRIW